MAIYNQYFVDLKISDVLYNLPEFILKIDIEML